MGTLRVRYLVERPRKRGGPLFYWMPTKKLREAGFLPIRLPDDPIQAAARAEAENRKLDAWYRGEPAPPKHRPDGLHALDDLFQRDDAFRATGDRTKRDYLYSIKPALAWADGVAVNRITRKAVKAWYRSQRDSRGAAAARNSIAALRRLLSFGYDEGWITENPATGMKVQGSPGRERVWTIAERDAFCAAALAAGRPSMALAVMLGWCLGQRPADLRTLTWSAYDGRAVQLRQAKTDQPVWVPVLPELRRLLDATPHRSPVMVISENTGRPYLESDFQHTFASIRDDSGLPKDLQFRDLRRTLATALGAAGCSDDQIRSITGHKTRAVVAIYVRPDRTFAEGAMKRLQGAARNKSRKGS